MSELAEIIIKDLTQTMRNTLNPFIEKIETTNKQYNTLLKIMSQMPEYQRIVKENIQLRISNEAVREINMKPLIVEPASVEPASVEPASVEPASVEPASVEPASVEPVILKPTIVENDMVEVNPIVDINADAVILEITPLIDSNIKDIDMLEHVKQIYETINISQERVSNEDEVEEEEVDEVEEEEVDEVEEEEVEEEEVDEEEVEEEDEVEEVEEEEVDEEEVEEEDEVEEVEEEVEEEEEVSIVEINGVEYYTSNEESGDIYKINANEDVGDKVGQFILGKPVINML
jgi:hypothetical protein